MRLLHHGGLSGSPAEARRLAMPAFAPVGLCFGVASAFGSPSASEGGRRGQDSNLHALAGATLAPWWLAN